MTPVGPNTRAFLRLARRVQRYGQFGVALLQATVAASRAGDAGRLFRLMVLTGKLEERMKRYAALRPGVLDAAAKAWASGEEELPAGIRFHSLISLGDLLEDTDAALEAVGYVPD